MEYSTSNLTTDLTLTSVRMLLSGLFAHELLTDFYERLVVHKLS